MSGLRNVEKKYFERLFEMEGGYVLHFSDRTFGEFFDDFAIDIHSDKYTKNGKSKAKKLRAFWDVEADKLVAEVLQRLLLLLEEDFQRRELEISDEKRIDLVGAHNAISRLKSEAKDVKQSDKIFFLATFSIRISDMTFSDFVKQIGTSNSMARFQSDLADLQDLLERKPDVIVSLSSGSSEENGATVALKDFTVSNVTFSEGSVVAKVQVGCAVIISATTFLASYPDAKDGLVELRSDLESLYDNLFAGYGNSSGDGGQTGLPSSSYYFLKPETAEENLLKIATQNGVFPRS